MQLPRPILQKIVVKSKVRLRAVFAVAGILTLLAGSSGSFNFIPQTVSAQTSPADKADLERQLHELEGQITQYQNQISQYQKQGKSLSGEIANLNAKIAKLNLQIKSVNLKLSDLTGKISATQLKINDLEVSIINNEQNLANLLKQIYMAESVSTLEVLLQSPTLSEFMTDLSHISSLQDNLHNTIVQIKDLRDDLTDQKQTLIVAKADAETLKKAQESQRTEVSSTKGEKDQLLKVTKGKESEYQTILKQKQAEAAKIRSRLFELLGGGAMTFGQAYQFAKVAEGATGVRAALILAILDRESALGKNVGQCSYHTAMNPKEKPVFVAITTALGINPETQKVSCPNADGIYGGAMGPAQFLPSTWRGYESGVKRITGRDVASPWVNQDAFIASGLYLRDAGAATSERMAAAKYYCGGNWNRYVCTEVYGRKVTDRAASFQADIDVLENRS